MIFDYLRDLGLKQSLSYPLPIGMKVEESRCQKVTVLHLSLGVLLEHSKLNNTRS